jgi:hypothetical protein
MQVLLKKAPSTAQILCFPFSGNLSDQFSCNGFYSPECLGCLLFSAWMILTVSFVSVGKVMFFS